MVVADTQSALTDPGAHAVDAEKAAVARVVHDAICWALTKDRALQESTMAHADELAIFWTDAGATVFGWHDYLKLFDVWMDPRFRATFTEIRDLRINLSPAGDAAWFTAMLDDLWEWDGAPGGARDIRWSGVLEKRAGKWVFVHMHGSLPADRAATRS